jgi:hemoglobin
MSMDESSAAARRAAFAADIQARTGIDEHMIERLIRAFYRRVQKDPLIGPVFAALIVDWEPHLQQMFAFWSSVTLMSGRYHGQPMRKHLPLPIDGRHFDRWLALFEQTARELLPPAAADHFAAAARRIGESLELGIATASGKMLAPGQRLHRSELDVA